MGTYTTNYNLFLPSIGEQGWGDLVNGNFITIDTTLSGLNTRIGIAETNVTSLTTRMGTAETTITSNKSRIGTLETKTDTMKEKLDKIDVESNGNIVGNLKGFSTGVFVNAKYTTEQTHSGIVGETEVQTLTKTDTLDRTQNSSTITIPGYVLKSLSYPLKVGPGLYLPDENHVNGNVPTASRSATCVMEKSLNSWYSSTKMIIYVNGVSVKTLTSNATSSVSDTITVNSGDTLYFSVRACKGTITVNNATGLYLMAD